MGQECSCMGKPPPMVGQYDALLPIPLHVLKSKAGEQKVFINVTVHDFVPQIEPYIYPGEKTLCQDKNGNNCIAIDVYIHPEYAKPFLLETSLKSNDSTKLNTQVIHAVNAAKLLDEPVDVNFTIPNISTKYKDQPIRSFTIAQLKANQLGALHIPPEADAPVEEQKEEEEDVVVPPPPPPTIHEGVPKTKKGWINKQASSKEHDWRDRWFELTAEWVCYYAKEITGTTTAANAGLKGAIRLNNCVVERTGPRELFIHAKDDRAGNMLNLQNVVKDRQHLRMRFEDEGAPLKKTGVFGTAYEAEWDIQGWLEAFRQHIAYASRDDVISTI